MHGATANSPAPGASPLGNDLNGLPPHGRLRREMRQFRAAKFKSTAYVASQFLAFCLGIFSFGAGLAFIFFPELTVDNAALGQFVPTSLHLIWPLIHTFGGFMLAFGIYTARYKLESAGCALLSVTIAFDAVAVIDVRGWESASVSVAIMIPVAVALAGRVIILSRQGTL